MCDWLLMDTLNKIQGGKAEAGSPGKQLLWGRGAGGGFGDREVEERW